MLTVPVLFIVFSPEYFNCSMPGYDYSALQWNIGVLTISHSCNATTSLVKVVRRLNLSEEVVEFPALCHVFDMHFLPNIELG